MPVYGRNETGRTEFESSSAEEPSRRDDLRDRFIASSDETETTRASAPERTNRVDRDERSDRATENPFERSDRNYTPDRSAPLQNRANLFDDEAEEDETETSEPDFTADRTRGVADRGTARGGFAEEPPKVVKEELPKPRIIKDYVRPSSDMLLTYNDNMGISTEESEATQRAIVDTLAGFHITVGIKRVLSGPVFTRYDINLPKSVDFGRIAKYKREMAMAIRTGGTINIYPNYQEGSVSIEVPNSKRSTVGLKPILQSPAYQNAKPGSLMFAIGMDAEGKCIVDDLCKMPHMLVAGTTGSGKSVFLHELIMSLIMKYSPEEVRLILIDPKWTEFSVYENLPHLMINEIIANPNRVIVALNWAIAEMEHRYTLFAQMTQKGVAVRNIDEYNSVVEKKEDKLPKIVLIADEVADLMAVAKNDIENRVGRIAAKARAAGIHLVLATQRPSVNVITGVLKSNLPSRFALRVSAEVDSRVILDSTGAENLLGKGDLLYKTGSMYEPKRVQSAWIDTPEIQKICDFIREHNEAYYDEKVAAYIDSEGKTTINNESSEETEEKGLEPVYIDALRFVVMTGSASISMIQRKCSIGFNKAGKIVDWMEQNGYISPFDGGAKSRKVLLTKEEFIEKFGEL
jgi:S-DNA-T family DNA segregation ATPase FtsK/SpoIIIE